MHEFPRFSPESQKKFCREQNGPCFPGSNLFPSVEPLGATRLQNRPPAVRPLARKPWFAQHFERFSRVSANKHFHPFPRAIRSGISPGRKLQTHKGNCLLTPRGGFLDGRLHSEPMEPSAKPFRDSDKGEPPASRGMDGARTLRKCPRPGGGTAWGGGGSRAGRPLRKTFHGGDN